jgi:hypothetical protein
MALNKVNFKNQLKNSSYSIAKDSMEVFMNALYKQEPRSYTQDEIIDIFAKKFSDLFSQKISNIIDSYIKTATVTVSAGQTIAGVSPSGTVTGATTSVGTGTIS